MKKRIIAATLCLSLALMAGCGNSRQAEEKSTQAQESTQEMDEITLEGATEDIVDNMSLEEKVGQLFIVCTDSLDPGAQKNISDKVKENLKKYQPGGIIFFSYNMKNRQQTIEYISNLQEASKTPLFIAVDEEGGSVQRVAKVPDMHVESVPSMQEIGATGDKQQAYDAGEKIANQISPLGFNLNFAPVVDLCDSSDNTEIGDRSFGSDVGVVSDMVSEEVKALQKNKVSATLKHFPGQGSVLEDTHKGYANLETTIDKLREKEFAPFEAGIDAGADFVMMSHISVKPITQTETPASLSKLMVSDILREELGYQGIIITDAMNMKVITKFYSSGQSAVQAIKAGDDMILMPEDLDEAYQAVLEEVKKGGISEKQLNNAVKRVISTKLKRGIISLETALLLKDS